MSLDSEILRMVQDELFFTFDSNICMKSLNKIKFYFYNNEEMEKFINHLRDSFNNDFLLLSTMIVYTLVSYSDILSC